MGEVSATRTDWYVVFNDGSEVSWLDRWQRPGFHHVYAARWDGRQWLIFEPTLSSFNVRAVPVLRYEDRDQVLRGTAAINVVSVADGRPRTGLIAPATCVEAIKHLLGIRAWWVITPWQLFNYLREGKHLDQLNG